MKILFYTAPKKGFNLWELQSPHGTKLAQGYYTRESRKAINRAFFGSNPILEPYANAKFFTSGMKFIIKLEMDETARKLSTFFIFEGTQLKITAPKPSNAISTLLSVLFENKANKTVSDALNLLRNKSFD